MKKIFTLSLVGLVTALLFTSCYKQDIPFDEGYWLSQERADVVYSDPSCSYVVVETNYGYTILRLFGSGRPYEGDALYGAFGRYGTRDFYNHSGHFVFTAQVTDYDLSYANAQYAIEYYCPFAKGHQIKVTGNDVQKASRAK